MATGGVYVVVWGAVLECDVDPGLLQVGMLQVKPGTEQTIKFNTTLEESGSLGAKLKVFCIRKQYGVLKLRERTLATPTNSFQNLMPEHVEVAFRDELVHG